MLNTIPISDQHKVYLANSIFRAVTDDLPEIIYENQLPTAVGSGLFRWNFINRNLMDENPVNFEISLPKRGAWRFALLRDSLTNFSFSIMTEQNFAKLQKHPPLKQHYLEALVSRNHWREPISSQLVIEDVLPERDGSALGELRELLLSEFSGIVDEHVLILFDYNYSGVTTVRAVLLTPTLDIAVSDDWTRFMRDKYIPQPSIFFEDSDEEESLVSLKTEYSLDAESMVEIASQNEAELKK